MTENNISIEERSSLNDLEAYALAEAERITKMEDDIDRKKRNLKYAKERLTKIERAILLMENGRMGKADKLLRNIADSHFNG